MRRGRRAVCEMAEPRECRVNGMTNEVYDSRATVEALHQVRDRAPTRMTAFDVRPRLQHFFDEVEVIEERLGEVVVEILRIAGAEHLPRRVVVVAGVWRDPR